MPAADVDNLLMEGPSGASSRSHLPILVAVFLVSAIAGGTLAGMIFSSRLAPGIRAAADGAAVAQGAAVPGKTDTTMAGTRVNETVITPHPAPVRIAGSSARPSARAVGATVPVGSPLPAPEKTQAEGRTGKATLPERTASRVTKDEARILPTHPAGGGIAVSASGEHRLGRSTSATSRKAASAAADPAPALPAVRALPAAAATTRAENAGIDAGTAVPAGGGKTTAVRDNTNNDELKALTDNVVAALAGLTQAGETATEQQTGNVREALSALVERALAEGRNEDDVARLLEQALADNGEAAVPAALRDASGKVDLRLLLASIVPMEAAHRASGAEQDYVNQLVAEGERTVVLEDGGRTAGSSRFYVRNGKRYTRIRPGDTLSRIAFEAYGDVLAYPLILRANAGRISIRRLKPGMEIEVPLRKDAALPRRGPVKLAPRPARATPRATRKATPRRKANRADTPARATDRAATQPASAAQHPPRKFINFRSRFTENPVPLQKRR